MTYRHYDDEVVQKDHHSSMERLQSENEWFFPKT